MKRLLMVGLFSGVLSLACSAGVGKMIFEKDLIEVSVSPDQEVLHVDFKFEVKDGPIEIVDFDAPCSCMEARISDGKFKWKAGEKGVVRGVFKLSRFQGTVDKAILLRLRGDKTPSVRLVTRAKIPILLEIDPKTTRWRHGDQPEAKEVRLTVKHSKPIHIKEIRSTATRFTYELETVRDGWEYVLKITPDQTKDPVLNVFVVETDCEFQRYRINQLFGVIDREKVKKE